MRRAVLFWSWREKKSLFIWSNYWAALDKRWKEKDGTNEKNSPSSLNQLISRGEIWWTEGDEKNNDLVNLVHLVMDRKREDGWVANYWENSSWTRCYSFLLKRLVVGWLVVPMSSKVSSTPLFLDLATALHKQALWSFKCPNIELVASKWQWNITISIKIMFLILC